MVALVAPALEFPVQPSVRAIGLTLVFWVCAGALQLAWSERAYGDGPLWGWLAFGLASLVLLLQILRPVRGRIIWDGAWQWQSKAYPMGTALARPEVVLDFQHLMLLRLRNADGAGWIVWVDSAARRSSWLDFRRALFSQANPPVAGSEANRTS